VKTDALTNPIVKAAIEALPNGDREAWDALFEPDVARFDDGSPRDFQHFTRDAMGHERFTSIESGREGWATRNRRFPLGPMGRLSNLFSLPSFARWKDPPT